MGCIYQYFAFGVIFLVALKTAPNHYRNLTWWKNILTDIKTCIWLENTPCSTLKFNRDSLSKQEMHLGIEYNSMEYIYGGWYTLQNLTWSVTFESFSSVLGCYFDKVTIHSETSTVLLLQTITVVQVPWGGSGIGLILAASCPAVIYPPLKL